MALGLAWLPHEVLYSIDAILRTLWRMTISRRLLLQWQTSSDVEKRSSNAPGTLWRLMWIGPVLAVVLAALLAWHRPMVLLVAAPLLLLWLLSPSIAWWISKPRVPPAFAPTAAQMRSCARWRARPGHSSMPMSGPPITGCRRTTCRYSRRRRSRIARHQRISDWPCWPISPPTTSVFSAPGACSIARADAGDDAVCCRAIAGTSTTGTTR
jgi:hypothetical protein